MHEFGLALEIIDIVRDTIEKEQVSSVHSVKLKIGKLMAIVPDSLIFGFETACSGTPLEGAKLEIEEVPVQAHCTKCSLNFPIDDWVFKCPECFSGHVEILSGKDMNIVSIEVEKDGCHNT